MVDVHVDLPNAGDGGHRSALYSPPALRTQRSTRLAMNYPFGVTCSEHSDALTRSPQLVGHIQFLSPIRRMP